jgi:hypothetical protein
MGEGARAGFRDAGRARVRVGKLEMRDGDAYREKTGRED